MGVASQDVSVAPPPVAPTPRNTGLDRARAVAVIAMVMGHTLDAVLSDTARQSTGMLAYWSLRAITAPLFLFVAGWAFATTVQRTGAHGLPVWRRYLPRVGLLLFWGYLLRWPGWALEGLLAGRVEIWRHFLAFDALHGVAGALLIGSGVLSVVAGRGPRMVVLAGLALLFPWVSPWMRQVVAAGHWPLALELALVGRMSNFPLFPWSAYFFVGCVAGLGLAGVKRVPHWMILLGGGTGMLGVVSLWGATVASRWGGDVTLVCWRVGLLGVAAGVAMLLPSRLDGWLGPVGRASLWVYVVHLPLAYGWSTFPGLGSRLGHSQTAPAALGLALVVLATSLAIALPAKAAYGRWRKRARPSAERDGALPSRPPVSE